MSFSVLKPRKYKQTKILTWKCCHVNVRVWLLWSCFIGPATGDALLKPQLLKMLPFTLSRLTITLQPSLEMFESQLLRLINADYHNTVRPSFSGFRNSRSLDSPCAWQITDSNRGRHEGSGITSNHIWLDHWLCPQVCRLYTQKHPSLVDNTQTECQF